MLYDKVYRTDLLAFAYRCGRANGGAPGVDGQDFSDLETYGLERWLGELTEELSSAFALLGRVRPTILLRNRDQPMRLGTRRARAVPPAPVYL